MKLGDFDIHALSDGTFCLDGGQMFGVVPKPLWERRIPADERNRIRLALTCLLVRTGRENALIETGVGDKYDAKFADIYGIDRRPSLLDDLGRHGLEPHQIDVVINSHLHFDHCGWNTRCEDGREVPTFPRARYYIQRGEWEHALAPTERDRASYIESYFRAAEGQTIFLEGDQQVLPGIRVQLVPGHSKNLQAVWVESRGERVCFVSDLIPTSAHVQYPWIMAFDLYPLETLESKKRLIPELVRDNVIVVFPHDAAMPWARLTERDGKIVAVPIGT